MRWLFAGLLALAWFIPTGASAQAGTTIRITAPASGDVLQGLVNVTGTSAVDGFFASELSFAYASDPTSTWFPIYSTDQPVTEGLLAAWDTNLVTDGDYDLRLRVTLQDGTILETLVTGLRVRNRTPTETATLAPTFSPGPADTPVPSPLPPTPMPAPTLALSEVEGATHYPGADVYARACRHARPLAAASYAHACSHACPERSRRGDALSCAHAAPAQPRRGDPDRNLLLPRTRYPAGLAHLRCLRHLPPPPPQLITDH